MNFLSHVLIAFLAIIFTFLVYPIAVGIFGIVFTLATLIYAGVMIFIIAAIFYFLFLFFFKKTTNLFR